MIHHRWCELLNLYDTRMQLTIMNRPIRQEEYRRQILLEPEEDGYDMYREEWNQVLLPEPYQGQEEHDEIQRFKYLTVSTETEEEGIAKDDLQRLVFETSSQLKKIGSQANALNTAERLELLHDVYRGDQIGEFDPEQIVVGRKRGESVQDLIAADCLEFKRDHMMIGEKYAQAIFVKDLPTFLTDLIVDDLMSVSCSMMLSIHYEPLDPLDAMKLVSRQILNMESNKMDRQKKGILGGYIEPYVPYQLRNALKEAEELLEDVVNRDQKLFLLSFVIVHIADDLDTLKKQKKAIFTVGRKKRCQMGVLYYQQEEGLNAALPLGVNRLTVNRCLTTESAGVFLPFSTLELNHKNGLYYGRNTRTGNLILFDRLHLKTPSGFYLGTPGSGKSFLAKREIINVLLTTQDDIIIIDPEREYTSVVKNFGGEVIPISAASHHHINPMDLTRDYSMGADGQYQDPLLLKVDFIMSLFEVLLGGERGLTPKEQSIVERCLRETYQPLMEHQWNREYMPTLREFYQTMKAQPEEEASDMAVTLEMYTEGTLQVFSHETNVNIQNRLICYDTKDLGKKLKTMGMLIVLDAIWNRVTQNREQGKRTWLYVDEMSLFFQSDYLSTYFDEVYRRFRKWGGIPTGITQNITPMLHHETARTMLSNSDFIIIMNQATSDRDQLASLLNISDSLLRFVTNAEEGYGLIFIGKSILPFYDKFPKNTKLYRMMTTKIEEVNSHDEEQKTWQL